MPRRKLTSDDERIDSGVDRTTTPDGCWLWTRSVGVHGYPQSSIGSRAEGTFHVVAVHRWMLERALGRPLRPGMNACHTCDIKRCVNPAHLWEGTTQENTADRERKGRGAKGERNRGFAHPERQRGTFRYNAAFTDDQVRDIRRRAAEGERQIDLAAEFGVWKTAIQKIVHRESWKHVV